MPQIILAKFPVRPPVAEKKCCTCRQVQPAENFYKGRSNKCRKCYKEAYQEKTKFF